MLTPEQRANRPRQLGASEVSAVLGISPYNATAMDVWLRKSNGTRPPMIEEDDELDAEKPWLEVGDVLEPSLIELYRRRTGLSVTHCSHITRRHPDYPWAVASPDGDVGGTHWLQLKAVGRWMASDWSDDRFPDYVRAQVSFECWVTGRDRCDVAALINGTSFQVYRYDRDPALEAAIVDAVKIFWCEHVEKDVPPPPGEHEDPKSYLAKRFPRHREDVLAVPADQAEYVSDLIDKYLTTKARVAAAKAEQAKAEGALCALVGEAAGIRGDFGTFTWRATKGSVSYLAVACDLAPMGVLPDSLLEKHRGAGSRRVHFTPAKVGKSKGAS